MIKVSVFYPDREGSKFDMDHYPGNHIPLVRENLDGACKGVAVEQGMGVLHRGGAGLYRDGKFRFDGGLSEGVRSPCRRHHG